MSEMNISGIGAGAASNGVNGVETQAPDNIKNKAKTKEPERFSSNENEQVELECTDGNDDDSISFGKKLKSFCNGLLNKIKSLFGGTPSGWKELSEKKQELTEQRRAVEQELIDISKQQQELSKNASSELADEIARYADKIELEQHYDKIGDNVKEGGNLHLE